MSRRLEGVWVVNASVNFIHFYSPAFLLSLVESSWRSDLAQSDVLDGSMLRAQGGDRDVGAPGTRS